MGKKKRKIGDVDEHKPKAQSSTDIEHPTSKWSGNKAYWVGPILVVLAGYFFLRTKPLQQFGSLYNKRGGNKLSRIGGWRPPSDHMVNKYDTSTCDIDRRLATDITPEEFRDTYLYKKPLIIKFWNGASGWTDPLRWTADSLKSAYGQWSVMSGNSRDIVRKGGSGDTDTSFSHFVDDMLGAETSAEPSYVFDRDFYNSSGLPETLHPPSYLAIKDSLDDSIFFLGSSGTGVSFHQHADAWNGVIYGRKRWFLYPTNTTPPGGVYPGFTQLEWYNFVYPNLPPEQKPLECIQEAGEIFYLPESVYHATINIGDTIAVGIQKKKSVTKIGKLFYEYAELEKKPQTETVQTRTRDIFLQMLNILPRNTEAMMKLGLAYKNMGDYSSALPHLQQAVERDPYFILAWLELAKVHEKLGDVTAAEECFVQALGYNTTLWDIFAFRGDFLLRNGRPKEAAAMYKKGISLKPDMVMFWSMLKLAQEQMGDHQGASMSQEWIDFLTM